MGGFQTSVLLEFKQKKEHDSNTLEREKERSLKEVYNQITNSGLDPNFDGL